MIHFRKEIVTARIRSPLKNFENSEENIEIRWDPLLAFTSRISRPKGLDKIPPDDPLTGFVKDSPPCFFCRGNVENKTPMLPEDINREGRIAVGEALLFPNLSGYGTFSGVCIFSGDHFIAIQDFTENQLFDALKACQLFLRQCSAAQQQVWYPSLNWNYLLPAGSSILHPHLQPFLDPFPTNFHRQLLEGSKNYRKEHSVSYWSQLKAQEKSGDRFLWQEGDCFLFTPFAPLGFYEINGLIGKGEPYTELTDLTLRELSVMIRKILQFYYHIKHNSFTLTLFSPPVPSRSEPVMPCLLKMCTRPAFTPFYRNDVTFFEKFHGETMIDRSPEETAADFKKFMSP